MSAEDDLVEYPLEPWGEQCDGTHPCMLPDGSTIYMYDLVAHCQPWAIGPDQQRAVSGHPQVPQEAIDAMGFVLRQHVDIELGLLEATLDAPSVLRNSPKAKPAPSGGCYKASFGWVHVRPGCRCGR